MGFHGRSTGETPRVRQSSASQAPRDVRTGEALTLREGAIAIEAPGGIFARCMSADRDPQDELRQIRATLVA